MTAFSFEQWKPRVSLRVLTRPRYTSSKRDPEESGIGQRKGGDVCPHSPNTPPTNSQALALHMGIQTTVIIETQLCFQGFRDRERCLGVF